MRRKTTKGKKLPKLKVIPIGGLNEIGKNMTLLEYDDRSRGLGDVYKRQTG